MAVFFEPRIRNQTNGDRLIRLEPFDLEKKQKISNLSRTLLDFLFQVLIIGTGRIRGVEQSGIAADSAQSFVNAFQLLHGAEQGGGRESLRILQGRAKPGCESPGPGAAVC